MPDQSEIFFLGEDFAENNDLQHDWKKNSELLVPPPKRESCVLRQRPAFPVDWKKLAGREIVAYLVLSNSKLSL